MLPAPQRRAANLSLDDRARWAHLGRPTLKSQLNVQYTVQVHRNRGIIKYHRTEVTV